MEYHRLHYGTKQKPTPAPLAEKLRMACGCHLSMAAGLHKDECNIHPNNLRSALSANVMNRAAMAEQLRRRTTLTAAQRSKALDHLYGLEVAISSGSASGPVAFFSPPPSPTTRTPPDSKSNGAQNPM